MLRWISSLRVPAFSALAIFISFGCDGAMWTTNSLLHVGRFNHTATLLPDARVLIAGGATFSTATNSAEIFDPATGTNVTINPLAIARAAHTATLLMNGKVLVVGGTNKSGTLASTELFDPISGMWTQSGNLNTARFAHTASLLPDGRVLVAGGCNANTFLSSSEFYDPATGTWTATANPMNTARGYHTATLLTNGSIYVCGGQSSNPYLASAEIFDPNTQSWNPASDLITARSGHTATLLANATVLIAGGNSANGKTNVEIFDPGTGNNSSTGYLKVGRAGHTATQLPNGTVLFLGGNGGSTAEYYDSVPSTNARTTNAPLAFGTGHSATLLADGRVLVVQNTSPGPSSGTELYDSTAPFWSSTLTAPSTIGPMVLLTNGLVLSVGGVTNLSTATNDVLGGLKTVELFNPNTGAWTAMNSMNYARGSHSVTLLPGGKVLVAGGYTFATNSPPGGTIAPLASELFDPVSGTWSISGNLKNIRSDHAAILLPTGKVLIAGGSCPTNSPLLACELYDPATGIWTLTGSLHTEHLSPQMSLLPNGKILLAGGYGSVPTAATEIYDPSAGTWTTNAPMNAARYKASSCLLPNGKVLVAGGLGSSSTYLSSAETYDYTSNKWTTVNSMTDTREAASGILLSGGKVLVAGGVYSTGGPTQYRGTSELFDPATGTWTNGPALTMGRAKIPMVWLTNGKALIAGGTNANSAELYDPGLAYTNTAQPHITSITALSIGSQLSISGTQFRGIGEGSGGNTQDASTDYPLVQLRSMDSGQILYVPVTSWTASSLTTAPFVGLAPGNTLTTVIVNGIPSGSSVINLGAPSGSPVLTGTRLNANSFQIDFLAAPGLRFGVYESATLPQSGFMIGTATENVPGQYRYVDSVYPRVNSQLFYSVQSY